MSTTEDRKELQVYELGYLILPSVAEEDLPLAVTKLKNIVKKAGGNEIASEDPFKIDLAYTMSKVLGSRKYVVSDAYIGWMKFEGESSSLALIEKEVTNQEEVLRSLIVKAPRETIFTFAEARRKIEEKEREAEEAKKALETPTEEPVVQ